MKKRVLAMMLTIGMIVSLTACGKESHGASGETAEEGAVKAPSICVVVTNASDKSFSESAARGAEMAAERFGCKTKVIEYGDDETKFLPTLEDISDSGWDIIVATGYAAKEGIEAMAKEYPDQKYVLLDQQVEDGYPNIYSADYKGNEGAFLAGALAAMITTAPQEEMPHANEDKVVGFVGGMDMTLINDFTLGFIQGATYIDPDIKTITSYTNSFSDAAKGKELAKIMYDSGCDVVYNGAGGAGMGCLEAGKEVGKYSIGTDSDQALLFKDDPDKANLILASQLKCLDENIIRVVEKYMAGEEIFGTNETLGLAEGMIRLADNDYYNTNVPQRMRDRIEELTEMIKKGEIEVNTAYGMEDSEIRSIIDGARPKH